ncbi:MAG: efflux RND transporter periplasmic adaptor subunit [Proteobacteria bacterium]|nr:efflux RND transporter periplasmic adaptor subunit [Pseudomonadota bacterium]
MQIPNSHKLLAMAVFLTAGLLVNSGCEKKNNAQGKRGPAGPPSVGVVVVENQRLPMTMKLSGRIAAHLVAEVRPQVSGIIKERLFTEGSEVKAGQVLYQIDAATYQAAGAGAKAALARAEAHLIPAQLKEQRLKGLRGAEAVSRQDYDDAFAALKQAEADVEAAKAALESTGINIAYTRISAPISGRIGRSSVTTGALVTAGQQAPLATIQQLDTVFVDVSQPSIEMLSLKRALAAGELQLSNTGEAKVKLILEDGTLYPMSGVLKFSEMSVDQGTGSVTLRTVFANPEQLLLPGMFVHAILETGIKEQAILVPQQGVSHDPAGRAIGMVVGEGDKVEIRILKVDRAIGDKWLVTDGLKKGDRLIVEGVQKARPGQPVKVTVVDSAQAALTSQSVSK